MNLLVYTDGSSAGEGAVRYAARQAPPGASVLLLHVVPSARQGALQNGEEVLARHQEIFRSLAGPGAPPGTRLEVGDAATRILEVADAFNADAIIMGSHGHGAFARSEVMSRAAEETVAATNRRVILVFPEGSEVVPAADGVPQPEARPG
ncbi:MAG: universal stress protein [Armatimonadetes bacterium]|nr:universal stress protein [Armatimonadota bacterium]